MNVNLPPAQEEFIQRKIAHGVFPSHDALISKAINLLEQQDYWAKDADTKIEQGWNETNARLLITEDTLIQHLSSEVASN